MGSGSLSGLACCLAPAVRRAGGGHWGARVLALGPTSQAWKHIAKGVGEHPTEGTGPRGGLSPRRKRHPRGASVARGRGDAPQRALSRGVERDICRNLIEAGLLGRPDRFAGRAARSPGRPGQRLADPCLVGLHGEALLAAVHAAGDDELVPLLGARLDVTAVDPIVGEPKKRNSAATSGSTTSTRSIAGRSTLHAHLHHDGCGPRLARRRSRRWRLARPCHRPSTRGSSSRRRRSANVASADPSPRRAASSSASAIVSHWAGVGIQG